MPEWQGRTYGSNRLHKMLIGLLRMTDVRLIYLISAVFVIPVCLLVNKSRGITYRYFRNRIGFSRSKSAWKTYRNHCLFAQLVIDRFAVYAGKHFDVEIIGQEDFERLASKEKAFIIMSSHLGNYELAGYMIRSERKRLNAVMFGGEKTSVMTNRAQVFAPTNVRIVPVMNDLSHIFTINEAIAAGEIVSFPSDRILDSGKKLRTQFLDADADFPMGPEVVATINELDVLAINVVKVATKRYRAYITPLLYDNTTPRRQQISDLHNAYVNELETRVRQYPEQWYNYYEFWK